MLLCLSGCARVNFEESLATTNQTAVDFTDGKLSLAQTAEQRALMAQTAATLLAQPLSQNDAVHLALINSPAMQAMLAQHWSDAARAAQSGRIANPLFVFERKTLAAEVEYERLLAFGLLDVLTFPLRYAAAQRRLEQSLVRLAMDVVENVTKVRQAWVKAVAAQQNLTYAKQVNEVGVISAELARRMQKVGNFSRLQRARQQAFYADAATQWAMAQQTATATREELIRALGLSDDQEQKLKLPERLPALPEAPRSPEEVSKAAQSGRLDIQLTKAAYDAAAKEQGLTLITSLTDIELGVRYDTVFDDAAGAHDNREGYEITVRLPVFDWGDMQRDAMNAQTLAAANRLEATVRAAGSSLRETYAAYRTAYDVSKHYRDEVLPLRKVISEENVLRYNGMLIGVFELLADTRDQVNTVIAAINAQQDFWLANAALQAAVIGNPIMVENGQQSAKTSQRVEMPH
ncbi:TolC family protein [Desulfobulbus sp.]|uniref:TolC family protein n=1 Tax=Desulfobulbus sp. TaxID=895 RepID=UPI0035A182CB